jgi:hypothetical protein
MIQNSNKSKEVFTSYWGMEGWAHVSFLVGVDGKPKDIVAIDFSGKERYIKSTFRYVNNLTYSPALVNGVPTISEKSLFVPHTISGLRYSVGSVTPIFSKEYQGAMDMLADTNANMSMVRVLIDDLKDDHTKNLIEHGLAAWLESAYYLGRKTFWNICVNHLSALNCINPPLYKSWLNPQLTYLKDNYIMVITKKLLRP